MDLKHESSITAHPSPFASFPFELEASWHDALKQELGKPYIESLKSFLIDERAGSVPIYPAEKDVFNAFSLTPLQDVKVVIIGQDPYHGPGQAHGLCFSVQEGVAIPPSLKNIFKELSSDLGVTPPSHGCLTAWAKQGVLLLNTTLTVRESTPMSHYGKGWETFTDAVIKTLGNHPSPLVFLLWGKFAQKKCDHLPLESEHLILKAAHPSPFSARGFLGCRHFSQANEFLLKHGKKPIIWGSPSLS